MLAVVCGSSLAASLWGKALRDRGCGRAIAWGVCGLHRLTVTVTPVPVTVSVSPLTEAMLPPAVIAYVSGSPDVVRAVSW